MVECVKSYPSENVRTISKVLVFYGYCITKITVLFHTSFLLFMCGLEKLKLDTITNVCDYFVLTFKRLSVMPRYKPTNPSEDTISRTWLTIVCLLSAVNKITSSD